MIYSKKDISIGDRVYQDDPEEPTENPYRGTVVEVSEVPETGLPFSFVVYVQLDEEFARQQYYKYICPDGILACFPWKISKEK